MPAWYRSKQYSSNSYYHIFNRGVEKRLIFLEKQDYAVFLSYLKEYLLPKDEAELEKHLKDPTATSKEKDKILKQLHLNNFADEIILLVYCLMPNHFHFLIKQKSASSIDKFMQSLATRYAMYFNRKYQRVGFLCQDVYKAVPAYTDEQLLNLSGYVHRNPGPEVPGGKITHSYCSQPSSYPEYLGLRKSAWVHPEEILSYFSKAYPQLSYQSFIEEANGLITIEPADKIILDLDGDF